MGTASLAKQEQTLNPLLQALVRKSVQKYVISQKRLTSYSAHAPIYYKLMEAESRKVEKIETFD